MLILASKSPRRKELLAQLTQAFTCYGADIDESVLTNEQPYAYVERLAIGKATAVRNKLTESCWVLGSDTAVVINGEILGKPKDQQDSLNMLNKLSGQCHQVLTSIALVSAQQTLSKVVTTEVSFKPLTEQEMLAYWQTGEPQDKAGSYGIQGIAGQFVTNIKGSYSAVVGLPLYETAQLLQQVGINTLSPSIGVEV